MRDLTRFRVLIALFSIESFARKKFFTAFGLLLLSVTTAQADLWINEFHYDNTGGDTGEFVEVVVAPSMASLSPKDITISLYNGSNGTVYDTLTLDEITPNSQGGFLIYSLGVTGLQNGSPDGIGLSFEDNGTNLVQLLSYEGPLTATNGPFNGQTSIDVGVSEPTSTPIGNSLQLTGSGSTYADFTWAGPLSASAGAANSGQTLVAVPEPSAFLCGSLICGVLAMKRRTSAARN